MPGAGVAHDLDRHFVRDFLRRLARNVGKLERGPRYCAVAESDVRDERRAAPAIDNQSDDGRREDKHVRPVHLLSDL
jgi:hypothetical protein